MTRSEMESHRTACVSLCLHIDKAGEYSLSVKPDKDVWQPINLRKLDLTRQ